MIEAGEQAGNIPAGGGKHEGRGAVTEDFDGAVGCRQHEGRLDRAERAVSLGLLLAIGRAGKRQISGDDPDAVCGADLDPAPRDGRDPERRYPNEDVGEERENRAQSCNGMATNGAEQAAMLYRPISHEQSACPERTIVRIAGSPLCSFPETPWPYAHGPGKGARMQISCISIASVVVNPKRVNRRFRTMRTAGGRRKAERKLHSRTLKNPRPSHLRPLDLERFQTGQFVCYLIRTDRLLPTLTAARRFRNRPAGL